MLANSTAIIAFIFFFWTSENFQTVTCCGQSLSCENRWQAYISSRPPPIFLMPLYKGRETNISTIHINFTPQHKWEYVSCEPWYHRINGNRKRAKWTQRILVRNGREYKMLQTASTPNNKWKWKRKAEKEAKHWDQMVEKNKPKSIYLIMVFPFMLA